MTSSSDDAMALPDVVAVEPIGNASVNTIVTVKPSRPRYELLEVYKRRGKYYLCVSLDPITLLTMAEASYTAVRPVSKYQHVKGMSIMSLEEQWNVEVDKIDEVVKGFLLTPRRSKVSDPRIPLSVQELLGAEIRLSKVDSSVFNYLKGLR